MDFGELKPVDQLVAAKYVLDRMKDAYEDARAGEQRRLTDEYLRDGTSTRKGRLGSIGVRVTPPKESRKVLVIRDMDAFMAWCEDNELPDGVEVEWTLAKPESVTFYVKPDRKKIDGHLAEISDGAVRGLLNG